VAELRIVGRSSVFKTPWFELFEKSVENDVSPHYSISTRDYVSVFAVTREGSFPLVRQFRAAVEMITLELPGGHVNEGETPEQAARTELREETGFIADELELLGALAPDTGRLSNRLWCFFARCVARCPTTIFVGEQGIEPMIYEKSLRNLLLAEPTFSSALNRATILMAVAKGHVEL
jgi:ADP-ribose diphosphatase